MNRRNPIAILGLLALAATQMTSLGLTSAKAEPGTRGHDSVLASVSRSQYVESDGTAIDGNGRAVDLFTIDGAAETLYVTRTSSSGKSSLRQKVATASAPGELGRPTVAVNSKGAAVIAWQSITDQGQRVRYVARRMSVSGRLSPVIALSPSYNTEDVGDSSLDVGIAYNGDAVIAYQTNTLLLRRWRASSAEPAAAHRVFSLAVGSNYDYAIKYAELLVSPNGAAAVVFPRWSTDLDGVQVSRVLPNGSIGRAKTIFAHSDSSLFEEAYSDGRTLAAIARSSAVVAAFEDDNGGVVVREVSAKNRLGASYHLKATKKCGENILQQPSVALTSHGTGFVTYLSECYTKTGVTSQLAVAFLSAAARPRSPGVAASGGQSQIIWSQLGVGPGNVGMVAWQKTMAKGALTSPCVVRISPTKKPVGDGCFTDVPRKDSNVSAPHSFASSGIRVALAVQSQSGRVLRLLQSP
jgi:hypothetical protein